MTPLAPALRSCGVYLRTMLLFGLIWYAVAESIGNRVLLPDPVMVAQAFWRLAVTGELFEHAAISIARMLVAVALAFLVALPLGIIMGLDRRAEDVIGPVVEVLRPISGIAWIPLALFMFGIGHALPIYIMFYAALFPILLGTIAGVHGVEKRLIDASRTMGVPLERTVLHVVLPAATPSILMSLRLGVASAWTSVIAAELVGAPNGLGYEIQWYRDMLITPRMMAFIAVVGVSGFACDAALRWLQRRLMPWAPTRLALL